MKKIFLALLLLSASGVCGYARDARTGLPDNLMGWMSARYGKKAMLGMKWENPGKAKTYYACATISSLSYAKPKLKVPLLIKVMLWPYFVIDTLVSSNSGKNPAPAGGK